MSNKEIAKKILSRLSGAPIQKLPADRKSLMSLFRNLRKTYPAPKLASDRRSSCFAAGFALAIREKGAAAVSKSQQRFMGAELARARAGEETVTGMSIKKLKEFASKPKGKRLPEKVKPS